VEEVEHFAGVELGSAADPVAACGLGSGSEIVLRGFGDLVLTAFCVGEAEVGHVEARLNEVGGILRVGEDGAVESDGSRSVAGVLGEVRDLEAEEVVVGVLVGETLLNDDGLCVASVVAQEERERGTGFDGSDDAVSGGFAEKVEAFFFVASYSCDADEHPDEAREAGDGELLDAHGHLGVGVLRVDFESGFAVVARGQALAGCGDITVVAESDKGGVQAASVSAGEVGVGVVGVGVDLLIGERYGGVGERFDAIADGLRNGHVAS